MLILHKFIAQCFGVLLGVLAGPLMVLADGSLGALHPGSSGLDISFPSTGGANDRVFGGFGTNEVCEGPSAVAYAGNYLVAFRLASKNDIEQGDVVMLKVAPNGTVLSTNVLYHDATGLDAGNVSLFKSAANTLLVFFNLYHWQDDTTPPNCMRVLRSTDAGATWTTNQVFNSGIYTLLAGKIVQCGNGDILFPYYQQNNATNAYRTAWLQRSQDDGVTLGSPVQMADLSALGFSADEPSLAAVGGSNVVCFIRADGGTIATYLAQSSDAGATWSAAVHRLGFVCKVDGLYTGTGLLLATSRRSADNSLGYSVSAETGATWSLERGIDNRYAANGGVFAYSSAVELYPGVCGVFYSYRTDWASTNAPLFLRYGTVETASSLTNSLLTLRALTLPFGQTNGMQLDLRAQGTEHQLTFGLDFDPAVLRFVQALPDSALAGVTLTVTTNQSSNGHVGVQLLWPAGQSAAAGWQVLAAAYFTGVSGATTTVSFSDAPLARAVVDGSAKLLGAVYANGLAAVGAPPVGQLSGLANPLGGGLVTGGGSYTVGSQVELSASASNLWQFAAWNDGVTNATRTVSVPENSATYTANFSPLGAVSGLAYPADGGSVTGAGQYLVGATATLTATASNGWLFTGWNGGVTNNPWLFSVPSGGALCTANFARLTTVSALASPTNGGTVAGGGSFLAGQSSTLTAVAHSAWSFLRWADGALNNPRSAVVPVGGATYTALFVPTTGLGLALEATNLQWTLGGNAAWTSQAGTQHGTAGAAQSGAIDAGQQSWLQTTTNGPGSLTFWWKVSSAPGNSLQFYIDTQLVSQISGNVDWTPYVGFIGTSNPVTLKWVYTKTSAVVTGSDAGWVDQLTWTPCPYAAHVPQLFYQDAKGLLASWVLGATGSFQFARLLANTGGWALKAAGDIDGDGVSDLLFQAPNGDAGSWLMNADGSVRDARSWGNLGSWEIKACGDYEGTGRSQLFFQTAGGDTAYWRLDTNGTPQASVPLGNMGNWKLRGIGDLDGDHKAELFWQNPAGLVAVWYHHPGGGIYGIPPFSTGGWALCGVADLDGDGVCDLLWQDGVGNTGGWFMNSNSTARAASFWWNTGGWKLKAAGR